MLCSELDQCDHCPDHGHGGTRPEHDHPLDQVGFAASETGCHLAAQLSNNALAFRPRVVEAGVHLRAQFSESLFPLCIEFGEPLLSPCIEFAKPLVDLYEPLFPFRVELHSTLLDLRIEAREVQPVQLSEFGAVRVVDEVQVAHQLVSQFVSESFIEFLRELCGYRHSASLGVVAGTNLNVRSAGGMGKMMRVGTKESAQSAVRCSLIRARLYLAPHTLHPHLSRS